MGGPLYGLQTADSSSCPHMGREQGEESSCLVTLRKVPTNPIHGGSSLMTSSHPDYPEAPPPAAIILGDRDPNMPFEGSSHSVCNSWENEELSSGEGLSFHLKHLLWQAGVPPMGRVRPWGDLSDH